MKNLRAVIADDHDLVRSMVASLLRSFGVDVVGEVSNGKDAVESDHVIFLPSPSSEWTVAMIPASLRGSRTACCIVRKEWADFVGNLEEDLVHRTGDPDPVPSTAGSSPRAG